MNDWALARSAAPEAAHLVMKVSMVLGLGLFICGYRSWLMLCAFWRRKINLRIFTGMGRGLVRGKWEIVAGHRNSGKHFSVGFLLHQGK